MAVFINIHDIYLGYLAKQSFFLLFFLRQVKSMVMNYSWESLASVNIFTDSNCTYEM